MTFLSPSFPALFSSWNSVLLLSCCWSAYFQAVPHQLCSCSCDLSSSLKLFCTTLTLAYIFHITAPYFLDLLLHSTERVVFALWKISHLYLKFSPLFLPYLVPPVYFKLIKHSIYSCSLDFPIYLYSISPLHSKGTTFAKIFSDILAKSQTSPIYFHHLWPLHCLLFCLKSFSVFASVTDLTCVSLSACLIIPLTYLLEALPYLCFLWVPHRSCPPFSSFIQTFSLNNLIYVSTIFAHLSSLCWPLDLGFYASRSFLLCKLKLKKTTASVKRLGVF